MSGKENIIEGETEVRIVVLVTLYMQRWCFFPGDINSIQQALFCVYYVKEIGDIK